MPPEPRAPDYFSTPSTTPPPPSIHPCPPSSPTSPSPSDPPSVALRTLLLFRLTDIHTGRKCTHAHAYTLVSIALVPTHPCLYIYRPIDRRQRRPTQSRAAIEKPASQPWRAPRLTSLSPSSADGHALRDRPGVPAAHPPAGGGARPRLRLPLRLGGTPCFPAGGGGGGGFVFLAGGHQVRTCLSAAVSSCNACIICMGWVGFTKWTAMHLQRSVVVLPGRMALRRRRSQLPR